MVYPISAHCMQFQRDEDGGFVVEAATVQDPIGFATALCDEHGVPLWGDELVQAVRALPLHHRAADPRQRREQRHRVGRRATVATATRSRSTLASRSESTARSSSPTTFSERQAPSVSTTPGC